MLVFGDLFPLTLYFPVLKQVLGFWYQCKWAGTSFHRLNIGIEWQGSSRISTYGNTQIRPKPEWCTQQRLGDVVGDYMPVERLEVYHNRKSTLKLES